MAEEPTRLRTLARQYSECQSDAQIALRQGDRPAVDAYLEDASRCLRALTRINVAYDAMVEKLETIRNIASEVRIGDRGSAWLEEIIDAAETALALAKG